MWWCTCLHPPAFLLIRPIFILFSLSWGRNLSVSQGPTSEKQASSEWGGPASSWHVLHHCPDPIGEEAGPQEPLLTASREEPRQERISHCLRTNDTVSAATERVPSASLQLGHRSAPLVQS